MKYEPNINSTGLPYRGNINPTQPLHPIMQLFIFNVIIGSMIIKKLNEEKNGLIYEYKKQYSVFKCKTKRPVWFLFPGLGGEWPAMAKALMPIKAFKDKIEECHQILSEFNIDLKYLVIILKTRELFRR